MRQAGEKIAALERLRVQCATDIVTMTTLAIRPMSGSLRSSGPRW